MAHGKPDWNRTAGGLTTYQMDDLGELAARQGSIVTFDRRGDVVWLDDFEASVSKWEVNTGGTGSGAALSTVHARNGVQSLLLTAGSDGDHNVFIDRELPLPRTSTLGLEFSFHLPANVESVSYRLFLSDGVDSIFSQVDVNDDDNTLSFLNSAGGQTTFATDVAIDTGGNVFHTAKLVIDWQAREYVAFIYDDISHDISGNGLRIIGVPVGRKVTCRIVLVGDAAQNDTCHIDDVIVTQNEP